MELTAGQGTMSVTTTSPHLAQTLAAAVERAFGGHAAYSFSRNERLLRVLWQRE